MKFFEDFWKYLSEQGWLLELLAVVAGMLLASLLARRLMTFLQRSATRNARVWDDALVHAARRPVQMLIWFFGLLLIAQILLGDFIEAQWFAHLRAVGPLIFLGWFLIVLIREYHQLVSEKYRETGADFDQDMYAAVSRVLQALVIIVIGLTVLQSIGVGVSGILAFGGIGGLVVGFAAKDLLENFFGGLMLHMDRPFKTGDWIRSPDRQIEGTIEHIGWRQTRIRTHSKNLVYVPNGVFLTIVIENPSLMTHRMIRETVGLRYDDLDKMQNIVAEINEHLIDAQDFDPDMPMLVRFECFNASSLDILVQCYTRTVHRAEYMAVKEALLFKIADIVARHGAEIAFPTQTLHVQTQTPAASDPKADV